MRNRFGLTAVSGVAATLLFCGLLVTSSQAQAPPAAAPGAPAAPTGPMKPGEAMREFSLTDSNGKAVSAKDLKGKPTALIFFTSACSMCAGEISDVKTLKEKKLPGLNVVLVNADFRPPADNFASYREKFAGDLPIWVDSKGVLVQMVSLSSTPAIALVDSKGIFKELHVGYNAAGQAVVEQKLADLK